MIRTFHVIFGVIWLLIPLTVIHASPSPSEPQLEEIANLCNIGSEPGDAICSGTHPGVSTTGQRTLTDSITTITTGISKAIALALTPQSLRGSSGTASYQDTQRTTGYAAGGTFTKWAGWASYARTTTDNTAFATKSDSSLNSALVGFDVSPGENMILGLAVGYEDNNIDTEFNAGEQNIDGFTIAPYFGYLFHPNASMDISAGYSNIDIDQFRIDSTNFTSIINGDTDSDRWFVSGNVNAFTRINDFALFGRFGIIYAEDDIDSIVETGGPDAFTTAGTTIEFGQIQVGGEVAYSVAPIEPYASVFYEYDYEFEKLSLNTALNPPANDRSDVRFGIGARYFGDYGFSANLEWSIIAGRDDIDSHTLGLTGRLDF